MHALLTALSMAPRATSHDECSAARRIVLEYYTSHSAGDVHKYYTCMRAATCSRLTRARDSLAPRYTRMSAATRSRLARASRASTECMAQLAIAHNEAA